MVIPHESFYPLSQSSCQNLLTPVNQDVTQITNLQSVTLRQQQQQQPQQPLNSPPAYSQTGEYIGTIGNNLSTRLSFSNKDNPNNHLLTDWPTGHFMVVRVLTLKKKLLLINVDSMSTLIRWLPLRINVAVVRAQFKRDCLISRQQSSVFIGSSGVAGISIDPS